MIFVRALYRLQSSSAAFRAFLAEMLHDMGFKPTKANPDVWIPAATKPCGFEYYELVLCYVDDLLAISHDAYGVLDRVHDKFKLKNNKIETPDSYLGADLFQITTANGLKCWAMGSWKYIKALICLLYTSPSPRD